MNTMFAMIAAGLYFLAAFVLMGRFVHKEGPNQRLATIMAIIAVLAHVGFSQRRNYDRAWSEHEHYQCVVAGVMANYRLHAIVSQRTA